MVLLTDEECVQWCEQRGIEVDENGILKRSEPVWEYSAPFPKKGFSYYPFARAVEAALTPRERCLVWVTGSGIWQSSENFHLFDRFRSTYGDRRLLEDAPGHLCQSYESAEVATLIHLVMLMGWDMVVLPYVGYATARISHDEFVELYFSSEELRDEMCQGFEGFAT